MTYTTEKTSVEFWSQWDGKPYTIELERHIGDDSLPEAVEYVLEKAFRLQGNNFEGRKVHPQIPTACTGDVVVFKNTAYFCDRIGWTPLNDLQFESWKEADRRDRSWMGSEVFSKKD